MTYEAAYINRNYRLKVYGVTESNERINKLVGVSGLIALIGLDLTQKCLERAERSMADKTTCKLRRGIIITFYTK